MSLLSGYLDDGLLSCSQCKVISIILLGNDIIFALETCIFNSKICIHIVQHPILKS